MTQVYFLIPGLLLPEAARPFLSAETLAVAERITRAAAGDAVTQVLTAGPAAASVHLAWLWRVLTRKPLPFASAPYAWLMDQGPELSGEIWRMHFAHDDGTALTDLDGRITNDAVESLAQLLRAPLDQAGFVLQRWDQTFYLTRKTDWGVEAAAWPVLRAGVINRDCALAARSDAAPDALPKAQETVRTINSLLAGARITTDGTQVNFTWIDGGGHGGRFYPPTKIRSVLTDDPAVLGWAQEAGILNHRTGKAKDAETWPGDAPPGECIAVLEDLYEPWLTRDWKTWSEKLPALVTHIETLAAASRIKNCEQALVVACGMTHTVSVPVRLPGAAARALSLLERLRGNSGLTAEAWLFEPD